MHKQFIARCYLSSIVIKSYQVDKQEDRMKSASAVALRSCRSDHYDDHQKYHHVIPGRFEFKDFFSRSDYFLPHTVPFHLCKQCALSKRTLKIFIIRIATCTAASATVKARPMAKIGLLLTDPPRS